jgi:hypothetical protein
MTAKLELEPMGDHAFQIVLVTDEWEAGSPDGKTVRVAMDGEAWLRAMYEVAELFSQGHEGLSVEAKADRARAFVQHAMDQAVKLYRTDGDLDLIRKHAVGAALTAFGELVKLRRVDGFELTWEGDWLVFFVMFPGAAKHERIGFDLGNGR